MEVMAIQAALPLLRLQGNGHILPVSSVGALWHHPTGGIYEGTKCALEAMAEALAAEVGGFGIKVTIIELGAFHTEFQSSIKNSRTIAEYDAVREKLWATFTPDMFGDPEATSEALFKVVDADEPPLRLVLGSS
jgi:NAD(P)-dependent dehydrogenase (short-subunit alcohol dehydrogenase family)